MAHAEIPVQPVGAGQLVQDGMVAHQEAHGPFRTSYKDRLLPEIYKDRSYQPGVHRPGTAVWPVAGLLVILAMLLVVIFNADAVNGRLRSWGLMPAPDKLTELYFEDKSAVPTGYTPSVPQQVTFTVHNLEYRPVTYAYTVMQFAPDHSRSQQLASGSFNTNQDDKHTETATITPSDVGKTTDIKVIVYEAPQASGDGGGNVKGGPDQGAGKIIQAIDYWAARN